MLLELVYVLCVVSALIAALYVVFQLRKRAEIDVALERQARLISIAKRQVFEAVGSLLHQTTHTDLAVQQQHAEAIARFRAYDSQLRDYLKTRDEVERMGGALLVVRRCRWASTLASLEGRAQRLAQVANELEVSMTRLRSAASSNVG